MSQQLQITGGAKVRDLNDVIIGTSGVLSSLAFNVANGVPKLDSNAKILVSQLPNSVMEYQGTWNANTNTPTLTNGGAFNQGDVYLCNVAGTTNFGAGPISFIVGDSAIYSGSIWQRSGGATGSVTSVGLSTNGDSITIGSSPITTSGTITANFNGTNLQYVNGAGNLTTFPTLISSIGLSMPSAFSVANSPLTSNGTIAVTGAGYPSQYIRGDGTLADFPTSGGGGSSVSYYLNGGTSQGTIGGVTYYEMSKTADTGTGVDFNKTGDGFIVAFLTDAGDPAQLNIPAGNWNYEIYASMSSNGGTPQLYAELYVYDGTTFTLISTSSNEILYDGVNLNLYTFAMAVPATTLALTDRLAIKLYSTNSGGKTTTVHTQDSHLCQIITTFSTGITALNGLTAQVQYFATGTSGTDFNISSATATHTFNIPDASASARGLITTGIQTIAGAKTFTGNIIADGSVLLKNNVTSFLAGYVNLGGIVTGNGFSVGLPNGGSPLINQLIFNSSAAYNYTFPAATGTLALTSNLSSYVPYTGATSTVNLGNNVIYSANAIIEGTGSLNGALSIKQYATPLTTGSGYTSLFAGTSSLGMTFGTSNAAFFDGSTITANRTYTLPNASGTLALTSDLTGYVTLATAQTITGLKKFDASLLLKDSATISTTSGYLALNFVKATTQSSLYLTSDTGFTSSLIFNNAASYNYTYPAATGTIALGTGTTNYLPKFTGTSTIGDSAITDNGTTVTLVSRALAGTSATFSSSVTATTATTGAAIKLGGLTNYGTIQDVNDVRRIWFENTGSYRTIFDLPSAGTEFAFRTNAGTYLLSLASTGAATFSSSVTANSSTTGTQVMANFAAANYGSPSSRTYIQIGTQYGDGSSRIGSINTTGNQSALIFQSHAATSGVWNDAMYISGGGEVGIGTSSPTYQLQLSTDSAAKPTSALWTIASDERIKENINPYKKGLQELLKINPITYDYNGLGGFAKGKGGVGIIAQEIIDILPNSVSSIKAKLYETDEEETDILNFNGHELTYVLINAIKEQQVQIEDLKARLDNAGL